MSRGRFRADPTRAARGSELHRRFAGISPHPGGPLRGLSWRTAFFRMVASLVFFQGVGQRGRPFSRAFTKGAGTKAPLVKALEKGNVHTPGNPRPPADRTDGVYAAFIEDKLKLCFQVFDHNEKTVLVFFLARCVDSVCPAGRQTVTTAV